jgi:hypothetical protein
MLNPRWNWLKVALVPTPRCANINQKSTDVSSSRAKRDDATNNSLTFGKFVVHTMPPNEKS